MPQKTGVRATHPEPLLQKPVCFLASERSTRASRPRASRPTRDFRPRCRLRAPPAHSTFHAPSAHSTFRAPSARWTFRAPAGRLTRSTRGRRPRRSRRAPRFWGRMRRPLRVVALKGQPASGLVGVRGVRHGLRVWGVGCAPPVARLLATGERCVAPCTV